MLSKSSHNFFSFSDRENLTAIIESEQTISYKSLFNQAKELSEALNLEIENEQKYVPVLIENSLNFIRTVLAIWYLRKVPVPINTKLLDDEIEYLLKDFNFPLLITDKTSLISLSEKVKILSFNHLLIKKNELEHLALPTLNDEAVVIFTSGSTGRPKGVVHTFQSLINNILNGNKILNHSANDIWLASLPFYHIGGFQIICRSFFYGCSIIIPQSIQTDYLASAIINNDPTHISLVSTQLERLLNQNIKASKSLKASLIGGGFINDELIIKADKLGWKPFRVYGSSETGSMVTAISSDEIKLKPQSVGKPFTNVNIKISDDSEILVQSNSLFKNYLDNEHGTKSKLANGFYNTGDLGFVDEDGYLFVEARRNDLIISGGENVNPIEVEKVLLDLPYITEACVFAKPDKTWGQIVSAVIITNNSEIDERIIKDELKLKLAGYKIPKKIFFVDKLPRTSLRKLEREKIRNSF